MTPRWPRSLLLALSLIAAVGAPAAQAQDATPAAEGGTLLVVGADELAAEGDVVLGFIRHTYAPGAGQMVTTGSGPLLLWIESGSLAVESLQGAGGRVIDSDSAASGMAAETGAELEAGQGLLLPAGSVATLRNSGQEPTLTLDLVAAIDAVLEPEEGVTEITLARREVALSPSTTLALDRATIAPGESLAAAPGAAETVVAPIDRAQAFVLSRNNFNRGTLPMPVYVLTLTPVEDGVATPTA